MIFRMFVYIMCLKPVFLNQLLTMSDEILNEVQTVQTIYYLLMNTQKYFRFETKFAGALQ